jgi:hypothetical protein
LKNRRTLSVIAFLMLSMVSMIDSIRLYVTPAKAVQLPYPGYPFVGVYPYNETCTVNETFTISVIAYNLTNNQVQDPHGMSMIPLGNLYGFDLELTWDPTVIHCLNHTVTTPVESYSTPILPSPYAGILHGCGPGNTTVLKVEDVVNETGNIPGAATSSVTAWFSYVSEFPAPVFNGNGTIATLTFKVLKKGQSQLKIASETTLSSADGKHIGYSPTVSEWLNPPLAGTVIVVGAPSIKSVAYWPSVGVVDKPLHFSASVTGNDTPVAKYMWDFGDRTGVKNTTTPTVDYNYTSSNTYSVTLRVADADGAESADFTTTGVMVADSRDLEAASIILSQSSIKPSRTITVTTIANNRDHASFKFNENCTLRLYYNTSSLGSSTTWVEVGTGKNASIPNFGGFEQTSFSLNSSSLPKLEAYYYFEFNVTGITSGYEANTANNVKLSTALLYTNKTTHGVLIDNFAFGYKATSASTPTLPVIKGEIANVSISVKNSGNDYDQFNVTFYVNNNVNKTWTTSMLAVNKSQTFIWVKALDAGIYNLTVVATGTNTSKTKDGVLTVIKTPSLTVNCSSLSPAVGQEVTINGSKSIDQDPNGKITNYLWRIFAPGFPTTGAANATFSGSNLTVISFTFNTPGNWTVLLTVTDNYSLTYSLKRDATSAYQKEVVIDVASGGLSLELVVGVVFVAVVVVIVVAVILLRRKRRPKPST